MHAASTYIAVVKRRQELAVAFLEEIAFRHRWSLTEAVRIFAIAYGEHPQAAELVESTGKVARP